MCYVGTLAASRRLDDTSLHFRMAVRAKQNALCGLRPDRGQRPRQPTLGNSEHLGGALAVVELQRAYVPVVSAQTATSAGFRDQDLLEPTPTARNGLRAATKASVDASAVEPELGGAVAMAIHRPSRGIHPSHAGGVFPPGACCSEPMPSQPVAHCRLAEPESPCDLTGRQSGVDQGCERSLVHPTLRRMPVAVHRRKPMALEPVADSRRVAPGELADLLEREPVA
jgi:hypothetical protein